MQDKPFEELVKTSEIGWGNSDVGVLRLCETPLLPSDVENWGVIIGLFSESRSKILNIVLLKYLSARNTVTLKINIKFKIGIYQKCYLYLYFYCLEYLTYLHENLTVHLTRFLLQFQHT